MLSKVTNETDENRNRPSYFDGTFVKLMKHVGTVVQLGLGTGRWTDLWSHGIRRWKVVVFIRLFHCQLSRNSSNTTNSEQQYIDTMSRRPTPHQIYTKTVMLDKLITIQ